VQLFARDVFLRVMRHCESSYSYWLVLQSCGEKHWQRTWAIQKERLTNLALRRWKVRGFQSAASSYGELHCRERLLVVLNEGVDLPRITSCQKNNNSSGRQTQWEAAVEVVSGNLQQRCEKSVWSWTHAHFRVTRKNTTVSWKSKAVAFWREIELIAISTFLDKVTS